MNDIDVSVIIINYNTSVLTQQCISSIQKHTSSTVSVEFIIVDNASEKADLISLEKFTHDQSDIQLIKSRINSGFALGNILGVQAAKGTFLAFINSDVLFVEGCFEKMVEFMNSRKEVGVCGIQILDEDHNETTSFRPFEGIRYKLLGKKFLYKTRPTHPKIGQKLNEPTEVDFTIGSFMFFRTEAYCEIGGFDPNTFLYYEETDVCYRLKQKGYKTLFLPQLRYIHLEGKSTNYKPQMKLEHLYSYLYVTRKNFGFLRYFAIKNYLIITYFFKAIFKAKHRSVFIGLLTAGECLSQSMRHQQKVKKH